MKIVNFYLEPASHRFKELNLNNVPRTWKLVGISKL